MTERRHFFDRRRFMAYFSGLGLTGTAFPQLLWAQTERQTELTTATVAAAERLAGLEFTEQEREQMLAGLADQAKSYEDLRGLTIDNSVTPALQFNPELPAFSDRSES